MDVITFEWIDQNLSIVPTSDPYKRYISFAGNRRSIYFHRSRYNMHLGNLDIYFCIDGCALLTNPTIDELNQLFTLLKIKDQAYSKT